MRFKRGDGVIFDADEGSESALLMTRDGGFELVEDESGQPAADGAQSEAKPKAKPQAKPKAKPQTLTPNPQSNE